ncbi:TonB-dependent receptor [Dyadobacter sp. 676]|uniref:TonB-dependent receptor n=1 Tax=Dyadobacter sp. 676 TaxID=3088362 RepID=A0AAU8FM97_9BACT
MKQFLAIVSMLVATHVYAQRITISGFVKEAKSQEQLPGVNVYIPGTSFGTVTNTYGFYSLTFPQTDSAAVLFSSVGYRRQERRIGLKGNGTLNVWLVHGNQLDEVVVTAHHENPASSVQMSQIDVPVQQIKKIPSFFGEKDILKVFQLMPGVQKGTEGQTGLYVRGGGPDQNLIILDDAVVYNANHLFGFFSVFNSDAIKSVELTKGGFPARFGGRLSSVVEMNMKEGSKDRLHGEGGIGLLSSRLTLEGPVRKEKSSFLLSARRTYADVLAAPIIAHAQKGQKDRTKPGYYFYDLNAKVNFDIGPKDKLYLSGYFGRDKFYMHEKSTFYRSNNGLDWGNATGTFRWNHLFSQKLFTNSSLIFSNFDFGVLNAFTDLNSEGAEIGYNSYRYNSRIRDVSVKTDFDYYPTSRHTIKFGLQGTFHRSRPSVLAITGTDINEPASQPVQTFDSFETGIYAEDTWHLFNALKINGGIRLSTFNTQGKTYIRPEPRVSTAVQLAQNLSMKLSYAAMNQYVHLLSNTGIGLPTDLWVPATRKIVPQRSEQFAGGFARYLERPALTVTLEGYYKKDGPYPFL